MTTPRPRLTALAGAALVTVIAAGCSQANPNPGITPLTTRTPSTTSTSPAAPTSTSLTAEEQAYAKAEVAYRQFTKSYAAAKTNHDPTKLDASVATPYLLAAVKAELDRLRPELATYKTTGRWTQDIQSTLGTKYDPGKLAQLQICAVTNSRFIRNGKDVTTDREGTPVGMNTTARANQIEFQSVDGGKTWKVNSFVYVGDRGAQC